MADPAPLNRQAAEKAGRRAETIAAWFLRLKGYSVVAERFRCPQGEVDLIVRRGGTLAFVEVKARADHDTALASVTPRAEARIAAAAMVWLARSKTVTAESIRYDIVTVVGWRPRHHADAFRPGAYQRSVNHGNFF